jgi:hypothetical protein
VTSEARVASTGAGGVVLRTRGLLTRRSQKPLRHIARCSKTILPRR